MRRVTTLAQIASGALAAGTLAWYRLKGTPEAVSGIFPNGVAYARLARGPKNLLWIRIGPGNAVPAGRLFTALSAFWLGQFLEAGYNVWGVTRKRNVPRGYTGADMAEDYARSVTGSSAGETSS